ncbi:MAG: C40 family peptidase [Longibaculum sp.]
MNKVKELCKNKRIIIGTIIIGILIVCVGGYFISENNRKQKIIDNMLITFNDVKEIEYGVKDYDIKKELVKEVKDAELKEVPKIDTSKIGEQTLKFILTKNGLEKEVEYKVNVKDTKAPEIKLKKDSIELTVGDKFDIKSNVESVKDPVDGDIKENDKASDLNKKATEEYNKLKKEDIKDNTKVADKNLKDFLIEDIKDKEEKNLYLKNCYYVSGDVDTETVGEYTIKVIAVDKNGLKTEKEFKVTVKEKEEEPVSDNNSGNASVGGNSGSSNYVNKGNSGNSSSSNNSGGGSAPVTKGSISDVIATAQAQVGKPYVAGGRGPNSFDCDGLVQYAFNQNGYNIGQARYAGYSIGTDLHNASAGDIIVTNNHVRIYLGGTNSVQAMNPSQGILSGYDQELAGWFQYYDYGDPNIKPVQILDIRRVR